MPTAKRVWRTKRVWVLVAALVGSSTVVAGAVAAQDGFDPTDYVGSVEVVRNGESDPPDAVRGTVFRDANRDSRFQDAPGEPGRRERGIPGVAVTNGRDVVVTDEHGRYELPAYEGMTVSVTKPPGYVTPVDEDHIPQFFYHHLPEGSPDLRFGGLPETGPLPQAINFPLAKWREPREFSCAIVGDTQTYSNREIGYLRDGVVADLADREDLDACGALVVGDVAGDDLDLYPRLKEVLSLAGAPVRAVPGNHDLDFDAASDDHSVDTFMREIGPPYYSYDVGDVHVVGLDNVRYPCTPEEDNADGQHGFCDDPEEHPTYNGVIGEEQLEWLANDLAHVDEDKLVVIATHIPLVSFIDSEATKHQTDDVEELYALLEGRPAVSVSGHAQTVENFLPGDSYAGWQDAVGVDAVPFQHIVAGAASGSWWTGNLGSDGLPEATQRGGAPPGYVNLAVDGSDYRDSYRATGRSQDEQLSLSLSSPFFREWYTTLTEWSGGDPDSWRDPPPVNVNDLGDPNLVTREDLAEGTALVANFWNGTTDTDLTVQVDDRQPVAATRTQEARGEGVRSGAAYADPAATMRQLQVTRYGLESTSGDERAQGWEAFRGAKFGPGPAQLLPSWLWTDQSSHLWRLPLPTDLEAGEHTATVEATDRHGRRFTETLQFEVAEERPPMFFRKEAFEE